MNGTRPLCDCKQGAISRIQPEGENEARFLCCECTIRATRVADVQGKLLDIRIFDPVQPYPVEVSELQPQLGEATADPTKVIDTTGV